MFQSESAASLGDGLSQAELLTLVRVLNSAMLKVNMVQRTFDRDEDEELVAMLLAAAGGENHHGHVSIRRLSNWLLTVAAVHLLVSRFQMTSEIYEKRADSDGLPHLISMVDPSAYLGSSSARSADSGYGSDGIPDEATIKSAVLSAVTGRQVLGELQFKTGLTPVQLGRLKQEFSARANVNGTLDRESFKDIMLEQFPSLANADGDVTLNRLFSTFDADNSGLIEFKEFVLGASKMVRGKLSDKIELLFRMFDADGSGVINMAEMMRFVKDGAEELAAVYSKAKRTLEGLQNSTSQKGIISEPEFVHLMLHDPVMVIWGSSVAQSASLQLVSRGLEEITYMLDNKDALSKSALESEGSKRPPPTPAESAAILAATFKFSALMAFWDSFILRKRNIANGKGGNGGNKSGTDDMFMRSLMAGPQSAAQQQAKRKASRQRGTRSRPVSRDNSDDEDGHDAGPGGYKGLAALTAGVAGSTNPQPVAPVVVAPRSNAAAEPQPFLEDAVQHDNIHKFLSATFGVEINRSLRGMNPALRALFETVAASSPSVAANPAPAAGHDAANPHSTSVSLAPSISALPVPLVLCQLGIALAKTPEELALVMYRQADLDGDGELTIAEMGRWMVAQQKTAGGGLSAGQQLLVSLDVDGDGQITEAEFRNGINRNPSLLDAFGYLLGALDVSAQQDVNKRSYISKAEKRRNSLMKGLSGPGPALSPRSGGTSALVVSAGSASAPAPSPLAASSSAAGLRATTDASNAATGHKQEATLAATDLNVNIMAAGWVDCGAGIGSGGGGGAGTGGGLDDVHAAAIEKARSTFAGLNLFGLGNGDDDEDEEQTKRARKLSEVERIGIRRRKTVLAGHKLQVQLEIEKNRMELTARTVRESLDQAQHRIDVQAQQQKLNIKLAKAILERPRAMDGHGAAAGYGMGGSVSARSNHGGGRSLSRPGSAAAAGSTSPYLRMDQHGAGAHHDHDAAGTARPRTAGAGVSTRNGALHGHVHQPGMMAARDWRQTRAFAAV